MAHELAHLKRRDLCWSWLAVVGRILFFFHPLVWLAKREIRLAQEMAADDLAVIVCRLRPVDYAAMLVEVAASWSLPQTEELVVGVVGSHKTLKRRLKAMKHISSMSNKRMTVSAIVIATVGLGVIVPWRIVAQDQTVESQSSQIVRSVFISDGSLPLQWKTVSKDKAVMAISVDLDGRYHCEGRVMDLNQIASKLKTASATDPNLVVMIRADQNAQYERLAELLDQLKAVGVSRVSLRTVAHAMLTPQILDIAFGVWRPDESKQIGPAVAGHEGDYWNAVGVAWNNDHTETGLKFASGEPSPVQVRMINLGGGWGNDGHMGVKAPMLDSYNYPVNNQGGDAHVILGELPAGKYDVYIYGHERYPEAYGDYTLTVGNHEYGRKATSNQSDAIKNTTWVEGSQYVKFTSVEVGVGDEVKIRIQPGGQVTDGGRTFTDATICGLQFIPVEK